GAAGERQDTLLEIGERQGAARWVAANNGSSGHGAGPRRQDRRRRHEPPGVLERADDPKHALAQTEHVWDAGPACAEEDDDALIDGERRRRDDDSPEAAQLAARDTKAQHRPGGALQIALDLERDHRLARAAILGPFRVERRATPASHG